MIRATGFFTVIPAAILLTVSYFIMYLNAKTENKGVKALGSVIIALLWIGAALVVLMGAYIVATGNHPAIAMIKAISQNMPCCKEMVK